jgi:hypothetical protein
MALIVIILDQYLEIFTLAYKEVNILVRQAKRKLASECESHLCKG